MFGLSLDDHGCEVIGGLSEVYFIAARTDPDRYQAYKKPLYAMLDRILEIGRNENGLFYMNINPITGEVLRDELTDNWGYDYNAFLTVAQMDRYEPYLSAVKFVLSTTSPESTDLSFPQLIQKIQANNKITIIDLLKLFFISSLLF